jgi:type VI secretion system protein ImpC
MNFDFSFKSASDRRSSSEPLRLAILGDFGGRPGDPESKSSGPLPVDSDNFDEVFARFGVTLDLPPNEKRPWEIKLQFRKLEDFHPEQLLLRLNSLAQLDELRAKLGQPATMDAAAKELQEILKIVTSPPETTLPPVTQESTEDMLARLLQRPASEPAKTSSAAGLANRLIQQIIGPNVASALPQQSQLVALTEAELATRLKAVLHDSDFQALEATWRGLDFLIRNITEEIKVSVIDLSKKELAGMLAAEDWAKSKINKQLEKIRPAVVLGIYTFEPEDHALLANIGRLAQANRISFVAGASPHLVGCDSFGSQPDPDDWKEDSSDELTGFETLRRTPEAARLGLAMPRFLLRQPYGKGSDPIEAFPFEEMSAKPGHESYLWGNPAFLCGLLMADAFASQDADLDLKDLSGGGEIGGLPIHKFTSEGETEVKPCAEAWLSERAAAAILRHGIMPVLSIQGRDAVQVFTLRTLGL